MFLTASRLVDRIRARIEDSGDLWSSHEILESADDVLTSIWDKVRAASAHYATDRIEIPVSSFTTIEKSWLEAELPSWVGDITYVEQVSSNGRTTPLKVFESDFYNKNAYAYAIGAAPRWMRSRYGQRAKFSVYGSLSSGSVRIWFNRVWPPMHYGKTVSVGGTTSLAFDTSANPPTGTRVGRVLRQDDVYEGMLLEILDDTSNPSNPNIDQLRRITEYDGATRTATLDEALPAALNTTTWYSLVIPLDRAHSRYFIEKVILELALRLGNNPYVAQSQGLIAMLESEFEMSIASRDTVNPPHMWSHRR